MGRHHRPVRRWRSTHGWVGALGVALLLLVLSAVVEQALVGAALAIAAGVCAIGAMWLFYLAHPQYRPPRSR